LEGLLDESPREVIPILGLHEACNEEDRARVVLSLGLNPDDDKSHHKHGRDKKDFNLQHTLKDIFEGLQSAPGIYANALKQCIKIYKYNPSTDRRV
jgi:hypothetical protein